jgi:hypothetical protein
MALRGGRPTPWYGIPGEGYTGVDYPRVATRGWAWDSGYQGVRDTRVRGPRVGWDWVWGNL